MATTVRRIGAVCVGAFLLAEAGLLNQRRATAHWKFGRELAERYPLVRVEREPLWVKDGNIYTSAGISAGIDLALAWVEEDCGASLAHEAARELVLFSTTAGRSTAGQRLSRLTGLGDVSDPRAADLDCRASRRQKLSVEQLAERMAMSVPTLQRVFTREVGVTPSHYVLQLRVEAARCHLEQKRSRAQADRLCGWLRQRRRHEESLRAPARDHARALS